MSAKKITIIISGICFLFGIGIGVLACRYLFPNIPALSSDLREENIYEVNHQECPEDEEPIINPECQVYVDVSGALNNPGVYCLPQGSLIIDAVKKAQGFNSKISLEYVERNINLAKPLSNNQKLYFPSKSELLCELKDFTLKEAEIIPPIASDGEEGSSGSTENPSGDSSQGEEDSTGCININTADITTLDSLEGVGLSTAQKIIDNRPYSSIEDLLKVSGIGEATFNKFKDKICI